MCGISSTVRLQADESSHLAPTPFGDSVDTLLSDVLPEVLARYDTVIAPHRLSTEPEETRLKLGGYVRGGGTLYITAATIIDLGSELLGVSVACAPAAYRGQNLSLCPLSVAGAVTGAGATVSDELVIDGQLAAARLSFPSGGVLRVVGVGRYGLAGELNASRHFNCAIKNQPDPGGAVSPYEPVAFVHEALVDTLAAAALFDLGPDLSWVPRRIAAKRYSLTVVNNAMTPRPLSITSLIGPVASIDKLSMDQSEKKVPIGQGWLPYGFDTAAVRAALGRSTATQIAGLDTRAFLVTLSADRTTALQPAPVGASPPRLLRLPAGAGAVRTEVLKRPSFQNYYDGVWLTNSGFIYMGVRHLCCFLRAHRRNAFSSAKHATLAQVRANATIQPSSFARQAWCSTGSTSSRVARRACCERPGGGGGASSGWWSTSPRVRTFPRLDLPTCRHSCRLPLARALSLSVCLSVHVSRWSAFFFFFHVRLL